MTALITGLFGYAVISAILGPRLRHATHAWRRASPRAGLLLWTTLITSWVIAVASAGLATIAQFSDGLGLAALLHACVRAARILVTVHDPAEIPAALALLGSFAFLLRLGAVATRQVQHNRRHRTSHRRQVDELSTTRRFGSQRITIVDTPELAAYCVPGRGSAIVLTTGTLRGLPTGELDAVIAHEQAHLRGRHHLYVGCASVLAKAFPFVPLLRIAEGEIARIVEWLADDQASHRYGGHSVARALAALATNSSTSKQPAAVLPATGSEVLDRVRRLLEPPDTRAARWPITVAIALPVLVLTAAIAVLTPAVTVDPTPLCQSHVGVTERSGWPAQH